MTNTQYISEDKAKEIQNIARLEDVASDFHTLKKAGAGHKMDCPKCTRKGKMEISPAKQIYKCFACDTGGVGPVDFLMKIEGKTYPEALIYLAGRYNILLDQPEANPVNKNHKTHRKETFRDVQLKQSGIDPKSQEWQDSVAEGKWIIRNRYESGSMDPFGAVIPGDDMILYYRGLDGEATLYKDKKGNKKQLIRVRHQNPELHKDREGKPMKYRSPYGSGNHLWIPNKIIDLYKQSAIIETLYVTEGEKKADKMTLHGMPALGIMGINNLAYGTMPYEFEMLIKHCGIANVVFLMDSDLFELGEGERVDYRPNSFYKAVIKFRDYFYAYRKAGMEVTIWLAYGKDKLRKGIDDLMVYDLKDKETDLKTDFESAKIDREGKGDFVKIHNITTLSEYKIQEMWHVQNTKAFTQYYIEALKKKKEFIIKGLRYKINEAGEAEMIQKLLPHEQFWTKETFEGKNGKERSIYKFNYHAAMKFLKNRGFGLHRYGDNNFRYVQTKDKVVEETNPHNIQHYVINFVEELQEIDVYNLIFAGGPQYLGPNSLSKMNYVNPEFIEPEKDEQYLFFKNGYWKITADGIEARSLNDLPKHVWSNKIINFEPKYIGKPMLAIDRAGENWTIQETKEAQRSDIYQFFMHTSNFIWKLTEEISSDSHGIATIKPKKHAEKITDDMLNQWFAHIVCKMIGAGYILHEYRNKGMMKAVIAMDGVETEVGKSQGGTGKSIYATMFEHLLPTEIIDAKKPRLQDDPHIYENVDERTAIIVFDDCRVNLDFEYFFSQITRGLDVNPKGQKRFKVQAPKFIFSTNHAMNGEGNSFARRQYLLAFSDYFNEHRTPAEVFGRQLFTEWDYDQWNLFYNFMATCIQVYLKYNDLNKYTIPCADIERRKLRQRIGENYLDFAETYFGDGGTPDKFDADNPTAGFLNRPVNKDRLISDYLKAFPKERSFTNARLLKEKTRLYCLYKNLFFNPGAGSDGRLKNSGSEYILVADDNLDAEKVWIRKIEG